MNRLALTSNFLIVSFFVFVIAYLWASYIVSGFLITFMVAFLITCLVNFCWLLLVGRNRKRNNLTKAERDHMNSVLLQFQFLTMSQSLAVVHNAISKKYDSGPEGGKIEIHLSQDMISVKDLNIFCVFHKNVTRQEIIDCINKTDDGKRTVVFGEFTPDLYAFFGALKLDVVLLNGEDLYVRLLKPVEIYPNLAVTTKSKSKLTMAALRTMTFSRRKVKSYILVGIIVLLTSLIVRPTILYVIIATILFSFAIISWLRPMQKNDNIFS
ncbi:MAG: hypothetical protein FWE45_02810 [Firmicutes bacterium]|nr:hypothetical protein [Bacillota bacterium]